MLYTERSYSRNFHRFIALLVFAGVLISSSRVAFANDVDVRKLKAKAERGYVKQELELAGAYLTGEGVTPDPRLAAYWYEKAAQSGNVEAQNRIGYFYQVGFGVQSDSARALRWYQLSAASGFSDAKLNLGVLYVLGLGVAKDGLMAEQYFHEAADRGNGLGATYLGMMYYFGIGVKQDKAAAEHWYSVGYKLHDALAAYNLGTLYSVASDHTHDYYKAAESLRQGAGQGYVPAIHSLALLLVHRPELARSPGEAHSLFESAAEVGYWRSSMVLGMLARDGDGVPRNSGLAYYHFQVAILQGGTMVRDLLRSDTQKLAEVLGPVQVAAVDADADAWFQTHHLTLSFVNKNSYKGKVLSLPAGSDPADILRAGLPVSSPAS